MRDRPIYRKRNNTFYCIKKDLKYLSVTNVTLFSITEITKAVLTEKHEILNREFISTKKEFESAFKKALKAIKN